MRNEITTFDYYALDIDGNEYKRKARIVGELPHNKVMEVLSKLKSIVGLIVGFDVKINYGVPMYVSMGIKKIDVKHPILFLKGEELPLNLI